MKRLVVGRGIDRGGRICRIRAIDIQRGKDGMGEGDDPREGRETWVISKA